MICKKCTVKGCENVHYAKDLCEKHYRRMYNHGTLDIKGHKPHKKTLLPKNNPVEYYTYRAMLNRCYNPNYASAKDYFYRGIKVCDRWLGIDGFKNFLNDMGNRPIGKHSLDRIDNNKGYSPENCRWATWLEQEGNRRTNNNIVGVSKHKQNGGWTAYISINGNRLMKCFRTKEEAIQQRRKWEATLI